MIDDSISYTNNDFHFKEYYDKFGKLPLDSQSIGFVYPSVIEYRISINESLQNAPEEQRQHKIYEFEYEIVKETLSWLQEQLSIAYREMGNVYLDPIYIPVLIYLREKEATLQELIKIEKGSVKNFTLMEKVLILTFLQEEKLFVSASEQTRITDLVAILLDHSKESVKTAFQKATKIMRSKDFSSSEAREYIKSLNKIIPSIERVEQTVIVEKIRKRIQQIENNAK